jgi:hypothetical protein
MSSRFDKLEVEIVDALRRAPSAQPSAELDARILARAHAAVRPVRRSQPRWMSVAAGLVVLVGSGLALRIWQQVEHAPTALDAPPAASQPAATAPATGGAAPTDGYADQATPPSEADRMSAREAAGPAQERQEAVNAVSISAETRRPALLAEPEKARAQSVPAIADVSKPGADLAHPFPAQAPAPGAAPPPAARPASAPAAAPPPPAEPAPQLAAEPAMAPPAAPPAPAPAAAAAAPAITGAMAKSEALAQPMAEEALVGADDRVGAARSAAGTLARDAAGTESKLADQAIDPWTAAIDALRRARDSGDDDSARRVLESLRRDFPQRELPEDLAAYADTLQ